MVGEWHYRILDQEFGPVSLDIIRDLVHEGQLRAQDVVRRDVREPWQRADTFPELFPDVSLFTLRPDVRQNGQDANVAGGAGWYCLVKGHVHGPVGLDVLRQWVADRRLCSDDLVREGHSDLWREAGSVEELFPVTTTEPSQPLSHPSPEEICDILAGVSVSSLERQTARAPRSDASLPIPAESIRASGKLSLPVPPDETSCAEADVLPESSFNDVPDERGTEPVAEAAAVKKQTDTPARKLSGRQLVLAGVVCLIGVAVAAWLLHNPDRRRYELMMTIHGQMQRLEQHNADRPQWRAFLTQAHTQIDPILGELKRSHSATSPHLLVAGQELLQAIQLETNGGHPSDVVEDFRWQMDRVAELLAGRPELDEKPRPTALTPDEKLQATTRLYLPIMLHGKTFTSGSYVWNADIDEISDIEIHKVVPDGEGWFEAHATVTAVDREMGYNLRAKLKVRYRVPPGSLGTAAGMQTIPFGEVTVLSIEPLGQPLAP